MSYKSYWSGPGHQAEMRGRDLKSRQCRTTKTTKASPKWTPVSTDMTSITTCVRIVRVRNESPSPERETKMKDVQNRLKSDELGPRTGPGDKIGGRTQLTWPLVRHR